MWPSYVINLAANKARMENSAAQLDAAGLPWNRIEAVNGWELSDADIARVYDAVANRTYAKYPLVKPEIGCYLSHIAAWRRIAESKYEGGFIFEDDFLSHENLGTVIELLSKDQRDWEMVKLFTLDQNPKIIARRALGEESEIVIPYRVPTCLLGYGLAKETARFLVDRAFPFFRPVDEDHKWFWETGIRVSLILPAPIVVGDQDAKTGTIGQERRKAAKDSSSRFRQGVRHFRFQLKYNLLLHWHRQVRHK